MSNNILDLRDVTIPVVYGTNGRLSVYDYIAYIRNKHENPWETCYFIENEHFFDNKLLDIYNLKSISEYEANALKEKDTTVVHTLEQVFYVITMDMLDIRHPDYGIHTLVRNFMMKYSVSQVHILLYVDSEDNKLGNSVIKYLQDKYPNGYMDDTQQLIMPYFAYAKRDAASNTIDISSYIDEMALMRDRETLTLQKLEEFEKYIVSEMNSPQKPNTIVYLGGGGNIVLRAFVSYLGLKYGLTYGVSEDSKLNWISECGFIYRYNRMSLYERIKFVKSLPLAMKYRPHKVLEVDCRYNGFTAPDVLAVYNYDTCEKVEMPIKLEDLDMEDLIDFREFFIEKTAVSSRTIQSSRFQSYADYETDIGIVERFIKMNPSKNINIRNSLLYRDKETNMTYLIYTEGDFVLHTEVAASGIFKREVFEIQEENFNKLFTHPGMSDRVGEVPLIMDIKSILILNILAYRPLYLSYYELALRWVITLEDNKYEGNVVDLFSYIPLENIRKEPNARHFITSFGKPLSFDKNTQNNIKLFLTNKLLSGKVLPR